MTYVPEISGMSILMTVAGMLATLSCIALAFLTFKNRRMRNEIARLAGNVEALSDRQWELREAEERTKSLLEAQGDLILRRDGHGHVTYANDAFCSLSGRAREALIGHPVAL